MGLQFIPNFCSDYLHNRLIGLITNTSQKIIQSGVLAIVLILLLCAFIFQSSKFPETAFEFVLILAFVVGIYGLILHRIWR